MKKFILLPVFLILGACQSSQIISEPVYKPEFQIFEINKITETGVQNFKIIPSDKTWPQVQYGSEVPLKYKSKDLRIAVVGDTGCRLKESQDGEAEYQNCSDPKEWPYAAAAKKISEEKYDFAIHTGDYHYREQCSNSKVCKSITNSTGDNWPTWHDDVYLPGLSITQKSPVIFMRGNHEECSRAGTGWLPLGAGKKTFFDACENIEKTLITQVGDVVFVNFDNSNFNEKKELTEQQENTYLSELKFVKERLMKIKNKKEIWFLVHKPVYGYYPLKKKGQKPAALSKNMSGLLDKAGLTPMIDYIISGHVHNAQVNVSKSGPVQIIVGHGGTALDPFDFNGAPKDLLSSTKTLSNFGYAMLQRRGLKKWNLEFKDLTGKIEMKCELKGSATNCKLF
jgi:hypothetical protein